MTVLIDDDFRWKCPQRIGWMGRYDGIMRRLRRCLARHLEEGGVPKFMSETLRNTEYGWEMTVLVTIGPWEPPAIDEDMGEGL